MEVVIVGSGNVATVLGRKIKRAGHTVLQVAGRSKTAVSRLADLLESSPVLDFEKITPNADLYLIAVSDRALYSIPGMFRSEKGIVVHTAGSVEMKVLAPYHKRCGIIYPLQSLRSEMEHIPEIPLLTEASDEETAEQITRFARSISEKVAEANSQQRMELHLAAVLTSNFTNHLYALADDYCRKKQLDFSLLHPLIEETATRIRKHDPAAVQTGPAARGDQVTIEKHRGLISDMPELRRLYDLLNDSIIRNAQQVRDAGSHNG